MVQCNLVWILSDYLIHIFACGVLKTRLISRFDLSRWQRLIQKPYENGDERGLKLVRAILRPLMLRRTKETKDKMGKYAFPYFVFSLKFLIASISVYHALRLLEVLSITTLQCLFQSHTGPPTSSY